MSTVQKYLFLCLLCCLSWTPADGQLLLNSHFHVLNPASSLNNCTTANVTAGSAMNRLQDMCNSWFTPTNGTPDYFYGCDNVGGPDYGVPMHNLFTGGCEDPFFPSSAYSEDMRAYAGIAIVDNPVLADRSREYVSQILPASLSPGKTYEVSFLVRSSNLNTKYLVQRLGCLLTAVPPNIANTADGDDGAITTTIGDYAEAVNIGGWDANSWQYVSVKIFVAGTTKTCLTIGNFQADIPDNEWVAQPGMGAVPPDEGEGYYMIDNVQICEVCAVNINVTRVASADPSKCCYDITFTANSNDFCGALYGFRLKSTDDGSIMYSSNAYISGSGNDVFNVCVDRFTSGAVVFEMFDENGAVVCSQVKELPCDCECRSFIDPPGVTISLVRNGTAPECCWDIVVANNSLCDVHLQGIIISTPGTITPAGGYSQDSVVSYGSTVPYLTKNNTSNGDTYAAGTSTVIGTICLPQNSLDVPVTISKFSSAGNGSASHCGAFLYTKLTCADACCMEVLEATKISIPSSDSLKCCFALNVALDMARTCIVDVTLQTSTGGGWVDELTMTNVPDGFSIPQCITRGTTKAVRLLFKNAAGEVVCVKEFTLACEEDCCSAVKNLHAYRVSSTPCCYRIRGDVQGCQIVDHLVQEYNPNTGMWNTIVPPTPLGPSGHFETLACISGSPRTIRVQFRNYNGTVVCTRWLNLSCGVTNKMGMGKTGETGEVDAYAAPNPSVGETTIHYTVQKEADVRVSLYNMLGELLAEVQPGVLSVGKQQTTLSTKELPAGMYFVQVQVGSHTMTVPLTVAR